MDKYMMMMFVTLEQETAVKHLFLCRGWKYRKQDTSKTTEEVGPPDNAPDTEEPVCPIVKPAPVGRPRKNRPISEEPQSKRTKFSENQTSVSATSADTSLTTAKTPARTATATATSASSSVTPSESSVSPRRSGRTPKPNRFRIKEEAVESTNEDESLQLPLILSVESLEDTSATDLATALESTTIPVTPSTSTLTTAQDITGISSDGFNIEIEQALDTKTDPDFDLVSEGDDYGDDDDDFGEESQDMDESATIDSEKKAAASSSGTGKDKKPASRMGGGGDEESEWEKGLRLIERRKAQQLHYEKTKRKRLIQETWLAEFWWLKEENGSLFCWVCQQFPSLADTKSSLFSGISSNFKKDTLKCHDKSKKHKKCAENIYSFAVVKQEN